MNNSTKLDLISFFLFSSIIFSYIISEDTLGGARQDFLKYEEIIYLFSSDLLGTLKNYASYEFTRNSPIFFILISFFHKIGLGIDTIRYINVVSIFIIIYFFFDCLKIKYKNINISVLKIFALILILSPTVRSLAVWPYPILYAFILFLVAIRYYLLFCRDKKNKLKNALFNVFFSAIHYISSSRNHYSRKYNICCTSISSAWGSCCLNLAFTRKGYHPSFLS